MSEITLLSASQVDSYRICSLRWWFGKVEHAEEEQRGGALVIGTVVDVALKSALHALRDGEIRLEELDPRPFFERAWAAELESTQIPISWGSGGIEKAQETAQRLVQHYLELEDLPDRVQRLEALDVSFQVPVEDPFTGGETGLTLRGIWDAAERIEGKLRVLDYKTSRSKAPYVETALATHLQAGLYAYANRVLHGDEASREVTFSVGLKTKAAEWIDRTVEITDEAIRRALLTVLHAWRGMKHGVALPSPGWACATCAFARRCASWQDHAHPWRSQDPFATEILTTSSRP